MLYPHDIEARRYEPRNRSGLFILADVGDDEMLAVELDRMSGIRGAMIVAPRRRCDAETQYPCALAERFFPEAMRLAWHRTPAS
jgi:hypothetical protein